MFTTLKSQFKWCIVCTLFTGIIIGAFATMLDYNEESSLYIIIMSIMSVISLILTTSYWRCIINQINLND